MGSGLDEVINSGFHFRGNCLLCTRCRVNVFNCHPDNDPFTALVVAETWLPSRCLAMDARSCHNIILRDHYNCHSILNSQLTHCSLTLSFRNAPSRNVLSVCLCVRVRVCSRFCVRITRTNEHCCEVAIPAWSLKGWVWWKRLIMCDLRHVYCYGKRDLRRWS
jgi:hypothetical protein